ncbi:MAG: cytochrome / NADPH-cytochrome reductase [Rhodospirillaceae bacterium]|nr:cytochrome / NADPH-cytochrome reductase [Rhodospirillaceae bacterium]
MARNKLHPIPHPPRTPVLGNMLTVDGGAPIQDLMRIAREQGPIFWLDMMGTPLVVVSGADLVAELCDEKRFDKAVRGSLRRVRMLGGDALFTAETQEPNCRRRTTSCCRPSHTA